MYLEAIDRASHHIYLTHAYFIPDVDMLSALIRAARRGVDVRIIVPARSNHIIADWLSRGYYGQLLRGGVRLFLYQEAMVHAKTATIDGQWSTIGTANVDRLSLFGNYEINIEVFNVDVARQMQEIFAIDSSNTVELSLAGVAPPPRHGQILRDGADARSARCSDALASRTAAHSPRRVGLGRRRASRPARGDGDRQADRDDQQDRPVDGESGRRLDLEGLEQRTGVGQQDDAADSDAEHVGRREAHRAPRRSARRSGRRSTGPARTPS